MLRRCLSKVALFIAFFIASTVFLIIRGTRSDDAHMSQTLKALLPGGLCLCQSSTTFLCDECLDCVNNSLDGIDLNQTALQNSWKFTFGYDDTNEGLTEDQCAASFPGLFEDIRRAVSLRKDNHITKEELDAIKVPRGTSQLRAKIYDGELYVLASEFYQESNRLRGISLLQSIARSMFASPHRRSLPNTEFVLSLNDIISDPSQPLWVLARRPQDQQVWLMPDFGLWSCQVDGTGPLNSVVSELDASELLFADKIPKLFWRGRLHYLPKLRRSLVDAAKNKPWSAVQALQIQPSISQDNFMIAADQCNYMFIAHAEGRSYSGSLKYRQMCRSVLVVHKLQWIQHHHYLLVAQGPQQNFVEVERDFSDLDYVMKKLLADPDEAKRIADNNIRAFRERYLTPAAEACYWRALIRGWGSVSFPAELYESHAEIGNSQGATGKQIGARFESYSLLKSDTQMSWTYKDSSAFGRSST